MYSWIHLIYGKYQKSLLSVEFVNIIKVLQCKHLGYVSSVISICICIYSIKNVMPQLPVYRPCIEYDLTYKCPTVLLLDSRNQYIGHTQLLIFLKVYSKGQGFTLKWKIHFEVLHALSLQASVTYKFKLIFNFLIAFFKRI